MTMMIIMDLTPPLKPATGDHFDYDDDDHDASDDDDDDRDDDDYGQTVVMIAMLMQDAHLQKSGTGVM